MKFRRRPEFVEAEQVQQGRIADGVVYHRRPDTVKDLDAGTSAPRYVWAVRTPDGWVQVRVGDWVVRFDSGIYKVYSPGAFNKFFEPV